MRAVLLPGNREVQVVDREQPRPGPGEVLIRVRASCLCRSDMSLYYGNPIVGGESAGSGGIVPGHEPAGDVAEVGEGVDNVAVGDRVAVYLAIGCDACEHCRAGNKMLCADWKCVGFDVDGGDADYMVAPAANCLPLPDALPYDVAAVLTDMVGTQYDAQRRLGVSGADTLAVFGIGPMGAAGVAVGKGRGARVIAIDSVGHRLEIARELGADEVIDISSEDAVARLRELTSGRGVDAAVECSGAPAAQNAALDAAAAYGRVAFVGESRETTIKPSEQLIRKQLTVIGAWYFPVWAWDDITRFVVERKLPVEKMITHRFAIEDAETAFRMFDARETEKAVFVWNDAA
jgi:threonine dehydrogenase-like Zn-dependent dehydrogenase